MLHFHQEICLDDSYTSTCAMMGRWRPGCRACRASGLSLQILNVRCGQKEKKKEKKRVSHRRVSLQHPSISICSPGLHTGNEPMRGNPSTDADGSLSHHLLLLAVAHGQLRS